MTTKTLENKIILITGTNRGIGKQLALTVAEQGATPILVGKDIKGLEAVYDEILNKFNIESAIYPINLLQATPKHIDELVQHINSMFGRLDGLVHNAGIYGQICPVENLDPFNWQKVIQVNLNIPFLLTHKLLPLLKKSTAGSIVFTIADEATTAKAYWSAYNASKAGVLMFAQTLQQELADSSNIKVNCINPKQVRTGFRINAYPGVDPTEFPLPETIMPEYIELLA